jgi:DNA (cytosine-5)-methyltransferase 1
LPEPVDYIEHPTILNHVGNPGARSYPGHTGSPLDEPSKTLKAGDHGVPGGENMIAFPDGRVRYFTVREAARLQGFPDDYRFSGPWTECLRQLGNAVPVGLAAAVADSVAAQLSAECEREQREVA